MIRKIHKTISFMLIGAMVTVLSINIPVKAEVKNIYNLTELEDYIYDGFKARRNNIQFCYKGDKLEFVSNITGSIKKAYSKDTYTERAWLNIEPHADATSDGIETSIIVTYLTSSEQEEYVNQQIDKILEEIIDNNMNDIQKVQAVNDYLVKRLDYDYSYASNNPFSALTTNKTVCQGYSMLVYKIMQKLNIECEIVVGTVDYTSHSWNKVKINNNWYYLDVTNNDTSNSNSFFLVSGSYLKNNHYVWIDEH